MIQSCTSESYSVISPFLPFRLNPIFPSLPLSGRRYLASVPSSPIRIVADADHRVELAASAGERTCHPPFLWPWSASVLTPTCLKGKKESRRRSSYYQPAASSLANHTP